MKRVFSVAARALLVTVFAAMTAKSALAAPLVIGDNYTGKDDDGPASNDTRDIVGDSNFDLDHISVDLVAGTITITGNYLKDGFDRLGTTISDLFLSTNGYVAPTTSTGSGDDMTSDNGVQWEYAVHVNGDTASIIQITSPTNPASYVASSLSFPGDFRAGQEVGGIGSVIGTAGVNWDHTNGVLTFSFTSGTTLAGLGFGEGDGLRFTETCANDVIEGAVPSVPEPTSMLLLGTGLVGLAGAARRRMNAR